MIIVIYLSEGAVASCLARAPWDRAALVLALAVFVLVQDTLLSQCLSPRKYINGYQRI